MQSHQGFTECVRQGFDIRPAYLAAPAGAQHLHDRFLGREPPCQAFCGIPAAEAVVPFAGCEDSIQEAFTVLAPYTCNAFYLHKINTMCDNRHHPPFTNH